VSDQLHTPATLLPGKNLIPIQEEAGWAPEPVWTFRRKENLLPLSSQYSDHATGWMVMGTHKKEAFLSSLTKNKSLNTEKNTFNLLKQVIVIVIVM
jgi:hypothetical protein